MPFLMSRVNVSVSRERELQIKSRLGKAIELAPGESEEYLMIGFEDNFHFYLRGDDSQPVAYIEIGVFGNAAHRGYDRLTAEITRIYNDVLGIAPDHIYVRYDDIKVWGVSGMTFDINQYRNEGGKMTWTTERAES
ncbi:MAG: hypothetical protein IJ702_05470 [Fretibacterium sp.]|nr:hypothetical protein [Fretibacterium sp.]